MQHLEWIHNDVKSGNILVNVKVTNEGMGILEVALADFGHASKGIEDVCTHPVGGTFVSFVPFFPFLSISTSQNTELSFNVSHSQ